MPPDPRMKVFESSKKAGLFKTVWSIGISSVIDEDNTVEAEFRHIKEAMVNWHARHGRQSQYVVLAFEANEDLHKAVLDYARWALNEDAQLFPIVKELAVKLVAIDPQSGARAECEGMSK